MGGGAADDYAHLVTMDPKIAERYGMVDESEYWGVDEEHDGEGSDDNPANEDSSDE